MCADALCSVSTICLRVSAEIRVKSGDPGEAEEIDSGELVIFLGVDQTMEVQNK